MDKIFLLELLVRLQNDGEKVFQQRPTVDKSRVADFVSNFHDGVLETNLLQNLLSQFVTCE
jgi:hypothetical protein